MDRERIDAAVEAYEQQLLASPQDEANSARAAERTRFDLADRYPNVPVARRTQAEDKRARRGEMDGLNGSPGSL